MSVRHRHPWGSAVNASHQASIALGKLAIIPAHERDERIVEAERHLRMSREAAEKAAGLLGAYYDVGRGVRRP
jgi:uncharacterized membrane protein